MGPLQIISGDVPSKSNSYKIITKRSKTGKVHASLAKTKKLLDYEKSFWAQCDKYRNAKISCEFKLIIYVYYSSKRPDLDNALKIVLDCLQKNKAIKNDNKCVGIDAKKRLDKKYPRIAFTINPA